MSEPQPYVKRGKNDATDAEAPKRKLENRQQRPAPETRPARAEMLEIADQRLGHPSLTRGNDGDSTPPGNNTPETGLRGPTEDSNSEYDESCDHPAGISLQDAANSLLGLINSLFGAN
jgi:hypothetical protein